MKIRTPEDTNRFLLALAPIDQVFRASEDKWGTGRLERLQSSAVLASYQRGWDAYRVALDDGDAEALEQVGPKMIAALRYMSDQATAAGHQPLAPDTWEAPLPDGTVLVVCRSNAEASAVIRAEREKAGRSMAEKPAENGAVFFSAETTLPPDLAITVRLQHEGRALTVWTMAELAALISRQPSGANRWEGTPAHTGVQQPEMMAHDVTRQGYPLSEPLATNPHPPATDPGALAF